MAESIPYDSEICEIRGDRRLAPERSGAAKIRSMESFSVCPIRQIEASTASRAQRAARGTGMGDASLALRV